MENRLKGLRMERGLTLANIQAKTNIDFKILENFEKGLENGIPNSLAIWQKLANFLKVPVEYLMGWTSNRTTMTINDLNPAEEDAYERITDMLNEDYPDGSISQSKIGKLLIDASFDEE
ncbi:helix-turn-helix domain-containing protein [Lactobacillus taiwanensis]|uniref:helix-turn-helix domain-containing protein n=1 Tax=Lactobacillus taiwanensis TaxID=508451 RepID=UPI00214B94C1|nr:helix-turn-helix transcriptional regulator [Lactobacillus taiwanensis]MCR1916231.1 helix-turn-helix domain-containing protein [Lactobacillus taiwanensis]